MLVSKHYEKRVIQNIVVLFMLLLHPFVLQAKQLCFTAAFRTELLSLNISNLDQIFQPDTCSLISITRCQVQLLGDVTSTFQL